MNEQQLLDKLSRCNNELEYDKLIDKYVFNISKTNKNTKNKRKDNHEMLSTSQMQHIQRKEISTHDLL